MNEWRQDSSANSRVITELADFLNHTQHSTLDNALSSSLRQTFRIWL